MIFLNFLFPLLSTSIVVNRAVQQSRFVTSKISYEDAVRSLGNWALSSAASKPSNAVKNVVTTIDSDGSGLRAADYLIGRWFSTKSHANSACKHGKVSLNGKKIYSSRILEAGDSLEIDFVESPPPSQSAEDKIRAETIAAVELRRLLNFTSHILDQRRYPPLHILYEDDDVAVVFKPSGIHSLKWIGTMKKKLFALDDILPLIITPPAIKYESGSGTNDSLKRPLPCHRLDARVSGCLIVAKTQRAMSDVSKQFENRYIDKEYTAILAGNLTKTLERDGLTTKASLVDWVESGGVRVGRITDPIDGFDAATGLQILDISPCPVYGALTTVVLSPYTGRRHQLRRHCAAIGCPIMGDDLYHNAGMLPAAERQSAIAALSVGKIKVNGTMDDEEGYDSEDSQDSAVSSSSDTQPSSDDQVLTAAEGVRKKVGIFLMCTGVEFYHPTQTLSGLDATDSMGSPRAQDIQGTPVFENIDRIKVRVRCDEVPRFMKLREKAKKGHDWQMTQQLQQ